MLHPPHGEELVPGGDLDRGLHLDVGGTSSTSSSRQQHVSVPALVSLSGKMEVLDRLLLKLHSRGHKVSGPGWRASVYSAALVLPHHCLA